MGKKQIELTQAEAALVANLRGIPEHLGNIRSRPIFTVAALLEAGLKKYKVGDRTPSMEIMAQWKELIGEKFAQRSCPLKLEHKTLTIRVVNTVIRNEMEFNKLNILRRLRAVKGCADLEKIVIQVQ